MTYAIYQLTRQGHIAHGFSSYRSPRDVMADVTSYLLDEITDDLRTPEKLREMLADVQLEVLQVIGDPQEVKDIQTCLEFREAYARLSSVADVLDAESHRLMDMLAFSIRKELYVRFNRYWLELNDSERASRRELIRQHALLACCHLNAIEQSHNVGVYTKFKEAFASSTASVTEVFYNPT